MNNKTLFKYNEKNFSSLDVISAIHNVGIKHGDTVFIHADLGKFGRLADVKNRIDFNREFLNACLNAIGDKGTLVIPTFTYTTSEEEIFDYYESPSKVGYFSELARTTPGFRRSDDPIFSVTSKGPKTAMLINNLSNQCFGKDSLFDRMYNINAKILNLGFYFYPTFIHFVESQCKVPYRYDKTFRIKIKKGNAEYKKSYVYNVRDLKLNPYPNIIALEKKAFEEETVKKIKLGGAMITSVKMKDLFRIASEMIHVNPAALVVFDKNCTINENLSK